MNRQWLIGVAALALASCATVPTPLKGDFPALTPREAVEQGATAQRVRWGGEIIEVQPKASTTCFEVLARALDWSARPMLRDPAGGRFIACRSGFYDPEVFERGRLVTVVGEVTGTDVAKVGEFDYRYPHVAADAIYLWPPRSQYSGPPPYWDPWMYGYPYGWGPYWGPYWGGSVIIRSGPRHPPRR
jgi:outer membrane lipoprotein